MLAALSVLLVVALSMVVTRVATIALTLTGLSREAARFQARSALTGVGYTTSEAEKVVDHPVRRRVVMTLMLVGSAGVVTVVASTALSFVGADDGGDTVSRLAVLGLGFAALWFAATSDHVDRALQPLIHRLLRRHTDLDTRDYARLLHVAGNYAVNEHAVSTGSWLCDRTLRELRLADEGVLVLGIQRGQGTRWIGAPDPDTAILEGDVLVLYGRDERLAELGSRGADDHAAHEEAIGQQREVEAREHGHAPSG